jgi:GNAT superfamily N-acetyltransferase
MIRRATPADAAALAELAVRIFTETYAADARPEDLAAHLAKSYGVRQQTEELESPDVITVVGEEEGRLIAFAQVRRNPAPACVTADIPLELWRFYVDRRWHGQGVAQRLMAGVGEAARALGGPRLWLSVWERNPRAIAFYQKCGFRDAGSTNFWLGSDRQTDRVLIADVASLGG